MVRQRYRYALMHASLYHIYDTALITLYGPVVGPRLVEWSYDEATAQRRTAEWNSAGSRYVPRYCRLCGDVEAGGASDSPLCAKCWLAYAEGVVQFMREDALQASRHAQG